MDTIKELIRDHIVAFGIVISIAWVASSFVLASGLSSINQKTTISVTGTAERFVQSDAGKWTFVITKQSAPENYAFISKQIRDNGDVAVKYLVNRGIDKNSITVQPLTSTMVCESQQQVMWDKTGGQQCSGAYTYSLSETIMVESNDVNALRDLSLNAAGALANSGVQIQTTSVEFYYSKLADIRAEMLAEAAKNAKERAVAIANSTGDSIGGVKDASQGVFQVTQKNSTEVADYGTYDTSTIDKKITAIVRVSFQVK